MTRSLHRMTSGRFRVWWITHGDQARLAVALVLLVSIFGIVGHFDYQDAIEAEQAARRDVSETLRQERAARPLERVTFVIEAKTPHEAQRKLAEIAGGIDAERMKAKR